MRLGLGLGLAGACSSGMVRSHNRTAVQIFCEMDRVAAAALEGEHV